MLHRVPIIASKSGGHVEIIKPGHNGVLVDLFDHNAYAKEAIKILSDNSFRKAMIQRAFIFAKNNYVRKSNFKIDSLIKCYQKIL